jgi:hypothetical protein
MKSRTCFSCGNPCYGYKEGIKMGGYRRYFPCEICKKIIDFKTVKDDEIEWELDGDGVAHSSCITKDIEDKWTSTDEMQMAVDIDEETMIKINRARFKQRGIKQHDKTRC